MANIRPCYKFLYEEVEPVTMLVIFIFFFNNCVVGVKYSNLVSTSVGPTGNCGWSSSQGLVFKPWV